MTQNEITVHSRQTQEETLCTVLKNNVVLNSQFLPQSHAVAIGFWFQVGSKNEDAFHRGVCHFTEHMLFKGTASLSSFEISNAFDKIGGYVNAYTDKENVCLYCTVPAQYSCNALKILCDITQNSCFFQDEIQKEKTVIQSEIASSKDDAEETAYDVLSLCLWKDKGLSQDISGSIEDVEKITQSVLLSWYEKYIKKGPLWVCVAGNFLQDEFEKELETLDMHTPPLLSSFASFVPTAPTTSLSSSASTTPTASSRATGATDIVNAKNDFAKSLDMWQDVWNEGLFFKKGEFLQTQVFFCCQVSYPLTQKDYNSYTLFDAAAGATMSSRLFQKLREEDGICYNVYSGFTFYEKTGFWAVYACCNKKHTLLLVQKLLCVIDDFLKVPFTKEELDMAKEHTIGEETIACEAVGYRAKKMDRDYFFGFPFLTQKEFEKQIKDVTKKDLNDCAKKLLGSKHSLLIYGRPLSFFSKRKIRQMYDSTLKVNTD